MKFYKLLFVPLIILQSCTWFSPKPEITIQSAFDRKDIAILDFSYRGNNLSAKQGAYTADILTEKLFLTGTYGIIDRARVREAQKLVGITSSTPMSADQIQKLGLRLKAKYLVVGSILNSSSDFSMDNREGELQVSFRVLSVLNGDVLGVVSHKRSYSDESVDEALTELLNQIAAKMPGVDI